MSRSKRHSFTYRKLLSIRKNVLDNKRLFRLKKKKWKSFQFFARKGLKFFNRFRAKDQSSFRIQRFANRNNSYMRRYKNNAREIMAFNLFYGGFRKKKLKQYFFKARMGKNSKHGIENVLNHFESRLDALLHRSRFAINAKGARQLIEHGHITVNGKIVKSHLYHVKDFDVVGVKKTVTSYELIRKNIKSSGLWPITPRYVEVNYNTLQIIPVFYLLKNKSFLINSYPLKIGTISDCIQYHK